MTARKLLFGPYVGEFGWELTFFAGYVRRLVEATRRNECDIHVMSYPGRHVFYGPEVTFHPLPPDFVGARISQNAYVTDQWIGDWPVIPNGATFQSNVSQTYEDLLSRAQADIGDLAQVVSPVRTFRCLFDPSRIFGTFISPLRPLSPRPLNIPIPLDQQARWRIAPFASDIARLKELRPTLFEVGDRPIVAVFPRCRAGRRPDKNWPESHYRTLIRRLQEAGALVVVVGAPGGCYFSDQSVPDGAVDLVNGIRETERLGLHVAALGRCSFAVGGISGALLMVMGCGVPVIEWGAALHEGETRHQNVLNTPLAYLHEQVPTLESVWDIVARALETGAVQDGSYAVAKDVVAFEESRQVGVPPLELLRMKVFHRVDRALFKLKGKSVAAKGPFALQIGQ